MKVSSAPHTEEEKQQQQKTTKKQPTKQQKNPQKTQLQNEENVKSLHFK